MIRVTVELLPFGFEEGRQTLAEMDIYNDGTGDVRIGNYGVRTYRKGTNREVVVHEGRVEKHNRVSAHVWNLVGKALRSVGYH